MTDTHNQLRPISMADSEKTGTPSHAPSVLGEKSLVEDVAPQTTGAALAAETILGDEKNHHNMVSDDKSSNRISTASAEEDEDDFEYPTKWKLTAITIGLCLSVFCMALVSKPTLLYQTQLTICSGQHHYRNSHSSYYRSIQSPQRCRLVRFSISPDDLRAPTHLR